MNHLFTLRHLAFCLATSVYFLLSIPTASAQTTRSAVSLCDVVKNPERYDNEEITVAAQYDSDGVEREGLSDPTCKESGIALLMLHETKGRDQLRAALHGGYPGTLDKTVTGTFIGVFHWDPKGHPPGVMNVRSMQDFTVHRKSVPFAAPKQ